MHLNPIGFNSRAIKESESESCKNNTQDLNLAIKGEWFLNTRSIVSETLPGALETLQPTVWEFFQGDSGVSDGCCGSEQLPGTARAKCHGQEVTAHHDLGTHLMSECSEGLSASLGPHACAVQCPLASPSVCPVCSQDCFSHGATKAFL